MPDFGKALRKLRLAFDPHPALRATLSQWERERPGEGRSFAAELKYLSSRWRTEPSQFTLDTSDILPPGETESTPLGSHYTIRVVHPHDYFHGKVRLSRLCPSDLQAFMSLMHERGAVPARERIIFLDTETTGV